MEKGKLIIIEGTDCSGKETQTNLLIERLKKENLKIAKLEFPNYKSPTGKIIGGPYLGKTAISKGFFDEGAINVDPKVAALYFAADRKYNSNKIIELLNSGYDVLLDRYVESNMGHQGGKILNKKNRIIMYKWLEKLEYELLELPKPDLIFFLHMPYKYAIELRSKRNEEIDQHEASEEHLKNAESAYLELAKLYNFKKIECIRNNERRSKEDINEEIYQLIKEFKNK